MKRLVNKKTWSKSDSVVFVQSTPGELLKKEVKKIMDDAGKSCREGWKKYEECVTTF